jgi:asparagine synthase (glutamine-hydrolysing)
VTGIGGVYEPTPDGGRLTLANGVAPTLVLGYVTNLDEPVAASVRSLISREGAAGIARMRGAFVVLDWDEDTRRGVLATDHLGTGGLFYHGDGRRLVFGTEIATVLGLLDVTPAPDEGALIRWLAYDAAPDAQTLYANVLRLRGGELIELGPDGYRLRTYWAPRYREPTSGTLDEHAAAVRAAADDAVAQRLSADGETGVLLSGGLDSSSIAAFGGTRPGARLRGYSAVFPDHPDIDESPLIADVAAAVGLPTTTLAVHGGSMLPASLEYLAKWRLPSASPTLLFMAPLARAAADDGVSVLLDGEGGDELFSGSPYVFADLLLHGRITAALRLADQLPGAGAQPRSKVLRGVLREWALKGAVPYAAHAALRRLRPSHYGAPWLTRAARETHGRESDRWEWKRLDGPRWWASLAFDFTQGRERMGAHDFLRHKSTDAGVQGRHPYFDDVDLVERMLAVPSEASFDATYDRPLLRRATAGLLPDSVRLRREKSYFNTLFDQVLTTTDRAALLELLDTRALIARHVRVDVLRGFLVGRAVRPPAWAWMIWRAAVAECWLRTLEDDSFPERAAERWKVAPARLEVDPASATALPT